MYDTFTARTGEDDTYEVEGIALPVPGLAMVRTDCACGSDNVVLMHVRSGCAVLLTHNSEALADPEVLKTLATVDWTASAADLAGSKSAAEAMREVARILGDGWLPTGTDDESRADVT